MLFDQVRNAVNKVNAQPILMLDGEAVITSLALLDIINQYREEEGKKPKRHDNFIRDIKSELGTELRAEVSSYVDSSGKANLLFNLDKDEALIMAMRESKLVRRKVVNRMNELHDIMEAQQSLLEERSNTITEFHSLKFALYEAREEQGKEMKPYIMSNEMNMLNVIIFGLTAKQFKEKHMIEVEDALRDYLPKEYLEVITALQLQDKALVDSGLDFQTRKKLLTDTFERKYSHKLQPL